MKFIIINGSPKINGNCSKLEESVSTLLKNEAFTVHSYQLEATKYQSCKGCDRCYTNGVCFINDSFKGIFEDIATADGLIFITPTFVSNVPGVLKMFIDRSNYVFGQNLTGKRIMNIVTYRNADANKVKKILNRYALFSGGIISQSLAVKIPDKLNDKNIKQVNKLTIKYIKDIKNNKSQTLIRGVIHSIVFHVGIKPAVKKNRDFYKGLINNWSDMNINI